MPSLQAVSVLTLLQQPTQRLLLALSTGIFLSGCNGGGEDPGATGPSITPGGTGILGSYYVNSFAPFETIASNLRDSVRYQFQNFSWNYVGDPTTYDSFALASSRAEYAHAVGLTGQGQTISIVDEGFRTTHQTLAGKSISTSGALALSDHGTGVASIAAGDSSQMIGIAPGADLSLGSFNSFASMTAATNQAIALGAVAQNNSWGYDALTANATNFNLLFAPGSAGETYLHALDAYAAQGVVVFAVSNDTTHTSATIMEALPVLRPSLTSGWLAVANATPTFDASGINSAVLQSAGCYEAAQWCLVADGTWMSATATSNSSYAIRTGSSFAAPQVSGALALLAEAFPALSPHDLRIRLLASADNGFFAHDGTVELVTGFFHGYNNLYGHGFLDIRAALLPIGTPTVTTGTAVVSAAQPAVLSSSAMGDAVARSLTGMNVVVTDSLSAGFQMPSEALVAAPQANSVGTTRLSELLSIDLQHSRLGASTISIDPFTAFDGQTLSFLSQPDGLTASLLMPGLGGDADSYGVGLVKDLLPNSDTRLELGLKFMHDGAGNIGFSDLQDGGLGADLAALHFGLSRDFDSGTFVSLSGEFGMGTLDTPTLLEGASSVQFNSFGLQAGKRNMLSRGDRLTIGLSMPMAITDGNARVSLPVSDGLGGSNLTAVALNLAPTHRQLDLSVSYQKPLADNLEMALELVHAEDHGNIAGQRDTAGIFALSYNF